MPRLAHLMVCDDIRLEANGKMMFIGVYNEETISVPIVPMILPQLNIYSKWDMSLERIKKFEITIKSPNDKTVAHLAGADNAIESGVMRRYAIIQVGMSPFNIEATGEYKISIKINDHAPIEMGAIKVMLQGQPANVLKM